MEDRPAPRGGPQHIPRPDGWRLGAPAPWSHLSSSDRKVDLDRIVDHFAQRGQPKNRAAVETSGQSAVLACLYPDEDGALRMILTQRSPKLRSHTLEVAFPGGREDDEDESLWHTALREAHEEVGLDPALPRMLGELDRFVTVGSGSLIHPFVAVVDERPSLEMNPDEVSELIEVTLDELLLDEVWREEVWRRGEKDWSITFFELHGNTVWGATAAILRQFLAEVTDVPDDRWGE